MNLALARSLAACTLMLIVFSGRPAVATDTLPLAETIAPNSATKLRLKAVRITGNHEIASEELQLLAAPLLGREIGLGEIEALRHAISQHYVELGYVNSGALYEDPAVVDGELRLRIVEGQVTRFEVSGNDGLRPSYLMGRLAPEGEILELGRLQERYQLLLADPLIERLDVALQPGRVPGEAGLVVEVVRARPWSLTTFANNYNSVSTGEAVAGAHAVVRNLTGYGDAADATLEFSGGAQRANVGWWVPLGSRGTYLGMRYEASDAQVVEAPLDDADVESQLSSSELILGQTVFERLDRRFGLALSYGRRSNTTTVFDQPFSFNAGEADGRSRVRVWRFAQELMLRDAALVLALRSSFAVGRSNALPDDPTDDQVFAARHFTYWVGQGQFLWQPGRGGWWVEARFAVQRSQDVLMPLERFSVGGRYSVRGYRENSLVRDNGYATSLEWHAPSPRGAPWLDTFVFYDSGAGWNRNGATDHLRSVGVGIRADYQGWQLELAWGHALKEPLPVVERGLQDRGLHLQVSYNF